MFSSSQSSEKAASLDAIGNRAERKQRDKRISFAVDDVQSVLNWSDRILHGATAAAPDRPRRNARQRTAAPGSVKTPPQPVRESTAAESSRAANDPVKAAAGTAVPLKPGTRLGNHARPGQKNRSRPTIQLAPDVVAPSVVTASAPQPESRSPQADPTLPSYQEIQRRRHQREKLSARRRVMKSTMIALVIGIMLAVMLQGYAWYATGSMIVASEVAVFSALLVLGPPLITILVGLTSLRSQRR